MSTTEPEFSPAKVRLALFLCFMVAAVEGFDLQVLSIAAPSLISDLGLTKPQIGNLFGASLFGLAVGALIGGWGADRLGRKPVLTIAVALLGVFTVAATLATGFNSLLVLRFLAGAAIGAGMPNLIALVSELSRKGRMTSSVTIMICGMPAGGIIVSLVGRAIAESMGWKGLFMAGGILPLILVPALWFGLIEPARKLINKSTRVAPAKALFGEGRAASTILLWATFILTLAMLSILLSWMPVLAVEKGLSRNEGFYAQIALNVGSIIGALAISTACERWGVRKPMVVIYLMMAVSLYLLGHAGSVSLVLLAALVAGFFVLGTQFALYGIAPRLYHTVYRGTGTGAAVAAGRVGSILGPMVAGALLGRGASGDQVVFLMAPLALLAGAALFVLTFKSGGALARGGDVIPTAAPTGPKPAGLQE